MVEYLTCEKCGEEVAENWLARHQRANCQRGIRRQPSRPSDEKTFTWRRARPIHGQEIQAWNKFIKRWEPYVYFADDGGVIASEDGWVGKVDRFYRLYPRWKE